MEFRRINHKKIKLLQPIQIFLGGIWIDIPKGFVTDGASIPKIFWWFGKPFDGETLIPAITHDYLYKRDECPRFLADLIFLILMEQSNVGFIKRWVYFKTVVLFGWIARLNHRLTRLFRNIVL